MSSGGTEEPAPSTDPSPGTPAGPDLPAADQDDDGIRPADGVTPEPTPVDLSAVPCPTVREDADLRVCSTTTDLDDAPVALVPPRRALFEPTTDDEAVEVFEFKLQNQSEATFGFNPYDWALKRHTAEDWVHVAPEMTPEPWTRLEPGEPYTYGLAVESVPTERVDGSRRVVLDIDSGVYAMVVDGQLGNGGDGEWVECVALFAVERSDR